jgi:hypothetical protein
MGVDIADINNDGLPDIMTLDMLPPDNRRQKLLQLQENYESFELMLNQGLYKQYMRNMLQLNNGDGTFSEIGQLAGLSPIPTGAGARLLQILITMGIRTYSSPTATCAIILIRISCVTGAIIR